MQIYVLFFALNTIFTLVAMWLHWDNFLGVGYTAAAMIVFVFTLVKLKVNLKNINYLSFARQPMAEDNIEEMFIKGDTSGAGGYGRYYIKDGKKII